MKQFQVVVVFVQEGESKARPEGKGVSSAGTQGRRSQAQSVSHGSIDSVMFVHIDGFHLKKGKVNAGSVVDKGSKEVDGVLEASKAIGKASLLATKRVLKPTVRSAPDQ